MNKMNPKLLSMFGLGGSMFGVKLMELSENDPNLFVLAADQATPAGLDKFKSKYPSRFANLGIAEQNMIGFGAGMNSEGYRVIAVAQACFITMRSFEQIRQYCGYMRIPLVVVGVGSGFSLSFMGNTHYALEDIALMRTIPGMTVTAPCDAIEAIKIFEEAVKTNSPVYIRLFGGTGAPIVHTEDFPLVLGKSVRMREGDDIEIIATGSMVKNALSAADFLKEQGVSASVIDMHTIKPLDASSIDISKRLIVTVEEHRIIGGLGSAVSDYVSVNGVHSRLLSIAVHDGFSAVGDYQYLLQENGLTPQQIYSRILETYNNL